MAHSSTSRSRAWLAGLAGGAAAAAGCFSYGVFVERNWFVLRRETVPCLPAGAAPLTVLHLSDIHLTPGQGKKIRWLRSLAQLQPDLVVNTGDNLSHVDAITPLLQALSPLMEFPGVFVPGSNDYFAPMPKNPLRYLAGPSKLPDGARAVREPVRLDTAALHAGFGKGGWINLTNRSQSIAMRGLRLDFTGVDDPHLNRERYAGWPAGAVGQETHRHVKIAVAHAPYQRVLDRFTADGADLILAGHTHGGQVCVPGYGALVTNCDLPTWRAKGLNDWKHSGRTSAVNVSGGIGTSPAAPFRFACRPEAVLLTLTAGP
ncbi:metallophosphoesterase [Paeniglutamicibacter antarcticus]|uniref:Metallophosphoesterase n=1 Tax=Arthrobacter terrae TaxID=2935737 RepID=A0A931GAW2_9MICC|nr:metallophosphoesterase [Arthrobacter terrae]MBG0740142.1 metallophosphoesterase [Arthrobacter terrae]